MKLKNKKIFEWNSFFKFYLCNYISEVFYWFCDENNNFQFKQFENDQFFEFGHFCVVRIGADVGGCYWKFKSFKTLLFSSSERASEGRMEGNGSIHNRFWQFDCFLFIILFSFFFSLFWPFSRVDPLAFHHISAEQTDERREWKKNRRCVFLLNWNVFKFGCFMNFIEWNSCFSRVFLCSLCSFVEWIIYCFLCSQE